jgi:anti-sigma factor RsiW
MSPGCDANEERLALHAGGDLPAPEARALQQHLGLCARCQARLEDHRETRRWLRRDPPPALPAEDYERLRRSVLERTARVAPQAPLLALLRRAWRSARQPALQPSLAAAALVLVALGSAGSLVRDGARFGLAPRAGAGAPLAAAARAPERPVDRGAGADGDLLVARAGVEGPAELAPGEEPDGTAADLMRIEMQTKDPDVRIIWFSPHADGAGGRN